MQQNLTNINPTSTSSDNNMMNLMHSISHTLMKGNMIQMIKLVASVKSSGPYLFL